MSLILLDYLASFMYSTASRVRAVALSAPKGLDGRDGFGFDCCTSAKSLELPRFSGRLEVWLLAHRFGLIHGLLMT